MKRKLAIILPLVLCFVFFSSLFSLLPFIKQASHKELDNAKQTGTFYYASASEQTGASTASSVYKGGAIYVGANSSYTMTNGSKSGYSRIYGGAVYVASGATFIMKGGVIESNSATYGGAVYVEAGGTFIMNGGTIRNNSAKTAPAVYIEDGGIFTMTANCVIEDNFYMSTNYQISEDTIKVGHITNGLDMHYIEYGTYPQTDVGSTMRATLESWYTSENPECVTQYTTTKNGDYGVWKSYRYTDGNLYARGICLFRPNSNIEIVGITTGDVAWVKIEPIKWVVLNYNNYVNGLDKEIKILSFLGIASYVAFISSDNFANYWDNSNLRKWLNGEFYNTAFSDMEKRRINTSFIRNNLPDDYITDASYDAGTPTYDKIWLLSSYEYNSVYFSTNEQRICAPTDFALHNYCYQEIWSNYSNLFSLSGGSGCYYTRSAGNNDRVGVVYVGGILSYNHLPYNMDHMIRPSLSLMI